MPYHYLISGKSGYIDFQNKDLFLHLNIHISTSTNYVSQSSPLGNRSSIDIGLAFSEFLIFLRININIYKIIRDHGRF